MIKDGLLDKRGKPNEKTPGNWSKAYIDVRWVNLGFLISWDENFVFFSAGSVKKEPQAERGVDEVSYFDFFWVACGWAVGSTVKSL